MGNDALKIILLVEDEAILAIATSRKLTAFGFRTLIAGSGEEAVRMATDPASSVDLILMDINLGKGMDGAEAARQILLRKTMPVVFLTSHTGQRMVEKVHGITHYGYVTKDSGDFVLKSSIEMAFELFQAHAKALLSKTTIERTGRIGGWEFDAETLVQTWTEETFRILEIDTTQGEPKVPEGLEFIAPEFRPLAEEALRRAMELGEGYDQEWEVISAKGNRKWVHAIAQAYQEQGRTRSLSGSFQDITERKRIEIELRETKAILQVALDQSDAGIAIADAPSGRLRYVNNAGLLIRGESREKVVNGIGVDQYVASWQLLNLDGTPLAPDAVPLARAVKFGETNSRRFIIRRARNDDRIVLANAAPIRDVNGQVSAAIVVFMDITDLMKAETALKKLATQLDLAQKSSGVGIWDWNVKEGSIEWTSQMFELFGLDMKKDEASFETWRRVLHPEDLTDAEARIGKALEDRVDLRNEYRILWPDGQVRWIQAIGKGFYDADGQAERMIGICIGITEHKRIEASLKESNEYLDNLFNYANAPIVVWNPEYRITRFNHAFESLTGLGSDEVVGRTIDLLFPPEQVEATMQKIRSTTTGARWETVEIGILRRDGTVRTVLWNSAAILDPARNVPVAIIAQGQDITERKQAEEELKKAYRDNRNLLAELQHRAKNSFNMISGMIQLATSADATPETRTVLEDLEGRVRSVSKLYSLLYSTGSFSEVRLDDYCAQVAGPMVSLSGNIHLETDFEACVVTAKIAAPIGLIVTELLTNAVKYAFPDNRQGTILMAIRKKRRGFLLEIRDDGVGPSKGFDLGTGLGIQLVRGLVEQIDGIFSIAGDAGGTRCTLEWKMKQGMEGSDD